MIRFKEFRKQLLNESKKQLDISIKAVSKYLTSDKRIEDFLHKQCLVEHKTDGVKITALKVRSQGRLSDWIIAYKGNIIYNEEFDFAVDSSVKNDSIGASQFKFVTEHFQNISKEAKSIPKGTELFIEYLMRKPTLSSDYKRKHRMILIGHTTSTFKEKNGKLITKPNEFLTNKRDEFADLCNLDTPSVLFDGELGNQHTFERSIKNKHLKEIFKKEKNSINWGYPKLLLDDLRSIFLEVESKYGGKEEGVVIKQSNNLLKWQQDYQLDKEARRELKLKYQNDDPEDETEYWNNVRRYALQISSEIEINSSSELKDLVKEISNQIKNIRIDFSHSKKKQINIFDDIQLTSKQIIMRKLDGNNNALIIGKFRVLSKAHYNIIQEGLNKFDGVVVALITSKETRKTKNLRKKMLEKAFGKKIEIVESTSGNLLTLMNKSDDNINYVIAGTDRASSYRTQLKRSPDVKVYEINRTDEDISASKIIENIENEEYFKKNVNPVLHNMYNEIKKTYSSEKM